MLIAERLSMSINDNPPLRKKPWPGEIRQEALQVYLAITAIRFRCFLKQKDLPALQLILPGIAPGGNHLLIPDIGLGITHHNGGLHANLTIQHIT